MNQTILFYLVIYCYRSIILYLDIPLVIQNILNTIYIYVSDFWASFLPSRQRLILTYWGTGQLNTLLPHYGKKKQYRNSKTFEAVINPDEAREEFLPFKRALSRSCGEMIPDENCEEKMRYYSAPEVFQKLFCADGKNNKNVCKGTIFIIVVLL